MLTYLIVIIANLLIGGMIGLTGIAGFLLPMLYSGFMGMPAVQALALSFFAFLISGILGSWNYYKAKNLDLKLAVFISIGSLIGAVIGVRLNLLIDEAIVKRILYTVVLLSGLSILLRKDKKRNTGNGHLRGQPGTGEKQTDPSSSLYPFRPDHRRCLRAVRRRRPDPCHAAAGSHGRSGQNSRGRRTF